MMFACFIDLRLLLFGSKANVLHVFLKLVGLVIFSIGLSACSEGGRGEETKQLVATPQPAETTPSLVPTPLLTRNPSSTSVQTPHLTASASPEPTGAKTLTPNAPACLQTGGQIEVRSLPTEQLRLPLEYRVYLPPCYAETADLRYPVLYLVHGQSFTDDQWDRLGVDELADELIAAGEIAPFLVVMPRDRYGGQPTENNFAQVILDELIPLIDAEYRTLADREHRAVGGLSRGAGWAVHLAITHPELFSALGAHSPAIFYTDAQMMRTWLDEIPVEALPRIYIDLGDKDRPEITDVSLWFGEILNQRSIPHEWHLFSGYHTEEYWSAHLEQYLRWYTQDW
jgi:enterochelin esterase-like enzyme